MRILVVSDTHGDADTLTRAILSQPEARTVVHLGDGAREAQEIADRFADRIFYILRGNCDWFNGDLPFSRTETVGGVKTLMAHGHTYSVKIGYDRLLMSARELGARLVLFGHTHRAYNAYDDGIYLFNPGSLHGGGSCGIVDITPAGIVVNHIGRK
ncbi:MAG: YfcE family phosphodiesterase [Oscillospiraceae bacterium]|nr:YfcE family phosphodiesterase [Oscillospiraceae bacterium]